MRFPFPSQENYPLNCSFLHVKLFLITFILAMELSFLKKTCLVNPLRHICSSPVSIFQMSIFFSLILSGICKPFLIFTVDSSRNYLITCMMGEKGSKLFCIYIYEIYIYVYKCVCVYYIYIYMYLTNILYLIWILQRSNTITKAQFLSVQDYFYNLL